MPAAVRAGYRLAFGGHHRRRVFAVGSAIVGVGIAGWLLFRVLPAARLRAQVDACVYRRAWVAPTMTDLEVRAAQRSMLQALGQRAVPLLVEDLERKPGAMARTRGWLERHGPDWLGRWLVSRPSADPAERRLLAVRALSAMGAMARPAGPALVRMLDDDDEWVRWEALEAIGSIGCDRPEWATWADSHRELITEWKGGPLLAITLWRLAPTDEVVVLRCGRATNPPVDLGERTVGLAAEALAELGPAGRPFAPWAASMMVQRSTLERAGRTAWEQQNRWRLARALWRMDCGPGPALEALRSFTNSVAAGEWSPRYDPRRELCRLAAGLAEVPALCAAVRPLLEQMDPAGDSELALCRSNALARVSAAGR